ncbi:hypothetical protein [Aquamicrobium defluvii]|uniref:hypothetical protein n=1 Tax=Aquamicrobium defluvii TaxID=69279 RepID=UPI00105E5DE6|nr:hypothetical protein [Aquamicrobium defluvii]
MKTIVAGLALEGNDAPVLPPAAQLARQRKARRILVHVVEPMTPADEQPSEGVDADVITTICETDAKNEFGTITAGMDPGIQVERVAAKGTPFEVGAILMRHQKAGLVIAGARKSRQHAGEGIRLDDRPHCPLIGYPDPRRQIEINGSYRHAIAAADFSAQSMSASATARSVAPRAAPRAAIERVHAVEMPLSFEHALLRPAQPGPILTAIGRPD